LRSLAPKDPVARYACLFMLDPVLPGHPESSEAMERIIRRRRIAALRHIHEAQGIDGVFRLARAVECPKDVGAAAIAAGVGLARLRRAARRAGAFREGVDGPVELCVLAALRDAKPHLRRRGLASLIGWLHRLARPSSEVAKVLVPYRGDPALQDLLDLQPEPVRRELRLLDPRDADDLRALLEAGRPVEALRACSAQFNDQDPAFLLDVLDALSGSGELQRSCDRSGNLAQMCSKALNRIEESGKIDRHRLCEVQLALLPLLENSLSRRSGDLLSCATLWRRLTSDPDWFATLLRNEQNPDKTVSPIGAALSIAIEHCPRIPGQRNDGSVDAEEFERFVDRLLELVRGSEHEWPCFNRLAALLSKSPSEPDDLWPCAPVTALMDRPDLEPLRECFVRWVCQRPIVMREIARAAAEDRERAEAFRKLASRWANRYPRANSSLRKIATHLDRSADRWQNYVHLSKENLA
jgi:hypothetical protein